MAQLANARHDFRTSVRWSRRAIATNAYDSSAYGLLGDALFELGDVGRADAAYQRMVDVRPDVASYVRASYAHQHHGRTAAAIATMRLALEAAGPTGETAAWVRHQMGDIYAGLGDFNESARQNRIGTEIAPGYVPPTVGIAETHIARGRLDKSLAIMEVAARDLPSLEYLITLGDLYYATGNESGADEQYAMVAEKLAAYRDAGVRADSDFTIFYADHRLRLRAALREARTAYEERPTQKIADALAWVLHANGLDHEAWRYAREALRGPVVDPTALFHAGSIAQSLGRDARAEALTRRALELDPAFSLVHAPTAQAALGSGS
jgi:tetratricopeptide (TPR) repeat protein